MSHVTARMEIESLLSATGLGGASGRGEVASQNLDAA
jgi:hypothetical protein